MENNLSIDAAGSILIGAGIAKIDSVQIALVLIGVGVGLKILVAFLQKKGIPVEGGLG